jgi:hypothetical protein
MKITIYSLIFKSTQFADWVYNAVHKNTPEIANREAKFVFIANNATEEVINHLNDKGYEFIEFFTDPKTNEELRDIGISEPWYIHSVYRGYNKAIEITETPYLAILNSDMYPAPGWVTSPLKYLEDQECVVTSQYVEPRRNGNIFRNRLTGVQVLERDFGQTLSSFDAEGFEKYAEEVKRPTTQPVVAYQPIFSRKETLSYPPGNILCEYWENSKPSGRVPFGQIEYGDEVMVRWLREKNIPVFQDNYSMAYHFDCGERLEKE